MGDATLPVALKHLSRRGEEVVCGFEFEGMQPRDYYALADLMYGDADALGRFLESRRVHKDLFRGSAQFLTWGVTEPIRALSYLFKRSSPEAVAAPSAPAVLEAVAEPAAFAPEAPSAVAPGAMLPNASTAPEPVAQPGGASAVAAAEPEPAPVEPAASDSAPGAAHPAEWLKQLLDMADWELRNAENMNQKAAGDPRGNADQEVESVSCAA